MYFGIKDWQDNLPQIDSKIDSKIDGKQNIRVDYNNLAKQEKQKSVTKHNNKTNTNKTNTDKLVILPVQRPKISQNSTEIGRKFGQKPKNNKINHKPAPPNPKIINPAAQKQQLEDRISRQVVEIDELVYHIKQMKSDDLRDQAFLSLVNYLLENGQYGEIENIIAMIKTPRTKQDVFILTVKHYEKTRSEKRDSLSNITESSRARDLAILLGLQEKLEQSK